MDQASISPFNADFDNLIDGKSFTTEASQFARDVVGLMMFT